MAKLTAVVPLLVFCSSLLSCGVGGAGYTLNPERLHLMKDALSWMTFRRNGSLATEEDVQDLFLKTITDKYSSSKLYSAFVMAFQKGVLPRLTLQENDPCDPAYTLKYKYPLNNSVTWHYQHKFTLESYDKWRSSDRTPYCDYRQGLVCNSGTRRCQCPTGTTMTPIAPHSPVRRCLLQKDEVCSLPDLAFGNDPKHKILGNVLSEMMFNLEKPEGCRNGMQCRFIKSNRNLARCYDTNAHSDHWYPEPPKFTTEPGLVIAVTITYDIKIGEECSLNWWADPGRCKWPDTSIGSTPASICFNFGLPPSKRIPGAVTRAGFCAHEYGSLSINADNPSANSWGSLSDPAPNLGRASFLMSFVNRRTVPLTAEELRAYYTRYIQDVFIPLLPYRDHFDNSVTVRNEDPPLVGEGHPCIVAGTLKMVEIWKFYLSLAEPPPTGKDFLPQATKKNLEAKMQEAADLVKGLAGGKICRMYQSSHPNTGFSKDLETGIWYEVLTYEDDPPLKCERNDGTASNTPNDGTCVRSGDNSTRAFGEMMREASSGSADADRHTSRVQKMEREADRIRKKVIEEEIAALKKQLELIDLYSHLGMGEACQHDVETEIRSLFEAKPEEEVKLYGILTSFPEVSKRGFCDATRLLSCTPKNMCSCANGTAPRKVVLSGRKYESDYCYFASGSCDQITVTDQLPVSPTEKRNQREHYGEPGGKCHQMNLCVFTAANGNKCASNGGGAIGSGWGDAGGGAIGSGWGDAGGGTHCQGSVTLISVWSILLQVTQSVLH